MEDKFLTDLQFCKKMNISVQTLHNHLKDSAKYPYLQKIKCNKIGDSRRWSEKSIEDFINNGE